MIQHICDKCGGTVPCGTINFMPDYAGDGNKELCEECFKKFCDLYSRFLERD